MTQIGETSNMSQDDPEKYIEAKVIELEFINNFKACLKKSVIKPPHWPATYDAMSQSSKAIVYAFNHKGSQKVKVKLKIDSKGYSGNGKLIGKFKNLEFEGKVPLASGEHTVEAVLKEPPTSTTWIKSSISWGIEASDISVLAGRTQVEVFFIFSDSAKALFFSKNGVWIEALRFIIGKGKLASVNKMDEAVARVTKACFDLPNHKYEVNQGSASFGGATTTFGLKSYMNGSPAFVNCYDQAYAVIVFSGALGIDVDGLFLQPFGYIKTVNLVGWGSCNNPFPHKVPVSKYLVVNAKDQDRSAFWNHMFCEYSAKIYDACAGPVKGSADRSGYLANTIDTVMPANAPSDYPGTASKIVNISAIGADVLAVV
jgi:hypothetical protein